MLIFPKRSWNIIIQNWNKLPHHGTDFNLRNIAYDLRILNLLLIKCYSFDLKSEDIYS